MGRRGGESNACRALNGGDGGDEKVQFQRRLPIAPAAKTGLPASGAGAKIQTPDGMDQFFNEPIAFDAFF